MEDKDLLKCMPVPYKALRYDLPALAAWTEILIRLLSKSTLTRKDAKFFTYACLGVAASRRKEKEGASWYITQAVKMADSIDRDIVQTIVTINSLLKD